MGPLPFFRVIKQILASCHREQWMGRPGKAFLLQRAVEMQLHVSGAFEFFEDQFVHPAAGFGERGREYGEAAAFFDIARASEKFLRLNESFGFDAARHDPALARLQIVIAARKAREAIEQNDDILFHFNEALRALEHELRDLNMPLHRSEEHTSELQSRFGISYAV